MKLISSVVVTLLTAALFAIGVSAPAQAYHPTVQTFATSTAADNTLRAGQRAQAIVRVASETGRSPDARIQVTIRNLRTGRVVTTFQRFYDGGRESFWTPRLRRGRYAVRIVVDPYAHRFSNDVTGFRLRVRR